MTTFEPKLIILLVPGHKKMSATAVEIFIGTLTIASDKFAALCLPVITSDCVPWYPNKVQYVNDLAGIGARGVTRQLDYSNFVTYLDNLLTTGQQNVVLPTERLDQLTALKNILGNKVVTLSVSYDSSMIRRIARDYIKTANFWNLDIFDNYTIDSLAAELPQSFDYDTDYKFNLADVYDLEKLKTFYKESFDEDFTEGKLQLWNDWKAKNDLLENL